MPLTLVTRSNSSTSRICISVIWRRRLVCARRLQGSVEVAVSRRIQRHQQTSLLSGGSVKRIKSRLWRSRQAMRMRRYSIGDPRSSDLDERWMEKVFTDRKHLLARTSTWPVRVHWKRCYEGSSRVHSVTKLLVVDTSCASAGSILLVFPSRNWYVCAHFYKPPPFFFGHLIRISTRIRECPILYFGDVLLYCRGHRLCMVGVLLAESRDSICCSQHV